MILAVGGLVVMFYHVVFFDEIADRDRLDLVLVELGQNAARAETPRADDTDSEFGHRMRSHYRGTKKRSFDSTDPVIAFPSPHDTFKRGRCGWLAVERLIARWPRRRSGR